MIEACSDTGLSNAQHSAIEAVLRRYADVDAAVLYGSRAMGCYRQGSDIDLVLLGFIDFATLNRISLELDDLLLPYEIDLSVFDAIENPQLREHIQRVGQFFYKKLVAR